MDKNELKSSLTLQDIEQVLKYFNVDYYYNTQDDIQMSTVCHGGDSHKLYYYPESESFRCYTDCSESFDIYDFIVKVSKTRGEIVNFHEAYKTLGVIAGVSTNTTIKRKIGFGDDSTNMIEDWNWIGNLKRRKKFEPKLDVIDESVLEQFKEWYPMPWVEESISVETMHKFGIKFNPERNQTVIPHRDVNSELVGIRVRNWKERDIEFGKYLPLYYEGEAYLHPLGYNIFALNEVKSAVQRLKKVVIAESEKAALMSHSFFGEESYTVALCGSSMNHYQADLLLSLGVEEVQIALDADYKQPSGIEFDKYLKKVEGIARLFINRATVKHITDVRGVLGYQENMFDAGQDTVVNILEHNKYEINELKELQEFADKASRELQHHR